MPHRMSAPQIIYGLSALADRYDILLCDIWGVIHNGREHFPAACDALIRFREHHGHVVLISNSPRVSSEVALQLDGLGVPRHAWSAMATSGDATRDLLRARAPGPVWTIGPPHESVIYDGLGLDFAGPQMAAFISLTGLENDDIETPEDYRERLKPAVARKLPLVCANPDRQVHKGSKLLWCAGGVAELYAEMGGGPVIMAGKPYAAIYDLALREAELLTGKPVERQRVLCIGDSAANDLGGANAQALDALFVAGGLHGEHVLNAAGGLDAAALTQLLASKGVHAAHAIPTLAW
ncbi:MAG: TIGR01459 family HAD-type hydrolase [Alphaproteobacteria bacterium]